MDIQKIRSCSHLLEAPAPEVVAELCDEIESLRAKLAAAEKDKPDAERWRWYRKYRATHQDDLTPAQEEFLMETSVRQDWLAGNATTPEQLDAITDAAIAKEKE